MSEKRGAARAGPDDKANYGGWRRQFTTERLKVLYYLGLVANPVFIVADVLLHREHLAELLLTRSILEAGLIASFLALKYRAPVITPNGLLILWVLIGNFCIVYMTVFLGGFTSQYYNGLNLVFLAAAVIVPVSWPSHLAAQLATIAAYYSANFLASVSTVDTNAAIENSFFLIWTSVALLFSVSLYERLQHAEFNARISESRARQELEESHKKLLELDRLKTEFFANISHELRTPLTLSLGALKTLLKLSPTPESQELIELGLRNTSRLLFLINELLDLAKFDSGLASARKRCIDFAALVRNVVTNFDSSQPRRIHLKGLSELVPMDADARQMKKVLFNLLSNAFKFSDPKEGQVWIRLVVKDMTIDLEIEDNGIGIPLDQQGRIFDRFTQVEGSATRRYEGSGIGLALVKEIVTLHDGTIAVDSCLGRGSIFTITLPRGSNSSLSNVVSLEEEDDITFLPVNCAADQVKEMPLIEPTIADRPMVIVADDNADMRTYLQRVLGRPYRVILANDGADALEQIRLNRPELVLTDAMMPRMSGYDLLKEIRADPTLRAIPVVFLTARAGTDARVESLEAGADDYLAKPFDEHELLARVGNLIRARAQERELVQLQKEKISRFLPSNLAEMILAGDREEFLKGHRTNITVVFIDLRGFTEFAESAAPEDLMAVLRDYQSQMGMIISEYGATLERFSGDALMVFLNDPLPMPNHIEQAVRMAIAMRHRVVDLCREWTRRGIGLGAGIGIATGYATLGVVGFEGRKDYAAIGPVTNLAARLCSEAIHEQILVSERVWQSVSNEFCGEHIGNLTLKGFQKPMPTYNIITSFGQPE